MNLGIHRIAVDDDLRDQSETARRQLAAEIEGEACVGADGNLSREHDAAFAVGDEIAAFRRRTGELIGRNRSQRAAHDVVAALMLLQKLDVAEKCDPLAVAIDLGDEAPPRHRVGVV